MPKEILYLLAASLHFYSTRNDAMKNFLLSELLDLDDDLLFLLKHNYLFCANNPR